MSAVAVVDDRWTNRGEQSLAEIVELRITRVERGRARDLAAERTARIRAELLAMTPGERERWRTVALDAVVRGQDRVEGGRTRRAPLDLRQLRELELDPYGRRVGGGELPYFSRRRLNGHGPHCRCQVCHAAVEDDPNVADRPDERYFPSGRT